MKSQTTSITKGFLTLEAMIALSVMVVVIPPLLSLSWSTDSLIISAQNSLMSLSASSTIISNGAFELADKHSFYSDEFGGVTCHLQADNQVKSFGTLDTYLPPDGFFGTTTAGVALTARNGFIYEAADSNSANQPDFFIIDARQASGPSVVSSLNTGPGLAAIVVAGSYAYVANKSSVSQLQIIDISDRSHPILISSLKLPLPTASSTAPHASAIFYKDDKVYLGTEKWDGAEFVMIDVVDPLHPHYLGGFETNSVVNSIFVIGTTAYIADADTKQMHIIDISDLLHMTETGYFSPSGSSVLEGKTLACFASSSPTYSSSTPPLLYFGRSGGGFNNPSQYEMFSFDPATSFGSSSQPSPVYAKDIPGGVYGIVAQGSNIFMATHDPFSFIQLWTDDFQRKIPLTLGTSTSGSGPIMPAGLSCDQNRLYSAVTTGKGFEINIPH